MHRSNKRLGVITATFGLYLALGGCGGGGGGGDGEGVQPPVQTAGDWATFQGNAAHTGFADVTFNPARFAVRWTWSRPAGDNEPNGGINSVATGAGKVFVSKDIYFGQGVLYALDEANGRVVWNYDLGPQAAMGPPAYAEGRVYVPSNDQASNCATWAVDAGTGAYQYKMAAACQWSAFFAPTPQGASVLHTSQAGQIYSFATAGGAQQWSADAHAYDQTTPAADTRYAYQYGTTGAAPALRVFDRTNGAVVASISDPFSTGFSGYSMFSAPMLSATGNVIAFSGGGFSGRAASSSEQYDSRVLISYNVAQARVNWRSADAYATHPAIANGVIYAARNAPSRLDALSETDGRILWSWPLSSGGSRFHRNVVVTRNLVFVSTDTHIQAIDLTTRQSVWTYPRSGMLAISANSVLYVVTGATISDGSLVAISLN